MSSVFILVFAVSCFVIAYLFYGRYIAKRLGIDANRQTPAHALKDGVDYVPAKAPVLLGHHFASIAGAAPIIGPITAAVFGWLPVLLWIIFGSIFMGAVHDFSAIIASVRHQGRSIGEVIEVEIGHKGKQLFLIFAWSTLVLVIASFTILVVKTFVQTPAVGTSSILFIFLAILFGLSIYRSGAPLGLATLIGIALLLGCVYLGIKYPLVFSSDTASFTRVWTYIILVYIFLASVTPVWILLQPRDYLNSFLLYILLIGALVGLIIKNPTVQFPAFIAFTDPQLGFIFPILFVTVACGAISGFHSLVSSGTTAKQLNSEKDARLIGYGGMLIESLLAVIALVTVIILLPKDAKTLANPITIFANGVGSFTASLGISEYAGVRFAALAISAFALTSLDTATRLGRFAFQEFFKSDQKTFLNNRYSATFLTILPAAILALTGSYQPIWPIFGTANQLLAALALLAMSVWLSKKSTRNHFLRYPMIIMFVVTVSALVVLIYTKMSELWQIVRDRPDVSAYEIASAFILALIALLLFIVSIVLVHEAYKSLKKIRT
ncbi:carbon starvation protein A [candidate division KSB1 bacterium]|nr:carbon starvation protein A [candidate division KSB1 bacterium]